MSRKVFLLAGEISGDKLGAELMEALAALKADTQFSGMGGAMMAQKGLDSSEDISQLSIMGISEVISAYSRLHSLADRLVSQVMTLKPDVIFTIDSKAFSVRFAKKLKVEMKRQNWSAPIIHMVAPTIWAWGRWRRHAFEASFDGLLCLFPFEPELFNNTKLQAHFIGHPTGFAKRATTDKREAKLIGMVPGSRRSEIRYILPDMLDAAERIIAQEPKTRFILPALPHLVEIIRSEAKARALPIEIISDNDAMHAVFTRASACMAASGTVTLELALNAMPAITCYKVNRLNYAFMRGLYRLKDPILPHILLGREIYPYFEQHRQTGATLSDAMQNIMDHLPAEEAKLATASEQLTQILTGREPTFQMQLQSALKPLLVNV